MSGDRKKIPVGSLLGSRLKCLSTPLAILLITILFQNLLSSSHSVLGNYVKKWLEKCNRVDSMSHHGTEVS